MDIDYLILPYYLIKILTLVSLAIAVFRKRKILPHSQFLLVVLVGGTISSIAGLFNIGISSVFYRYSINTLLYCSIAVVCMGSYSINMQLPGWVNLRRLLLLSLFPLSIFLILLFSELAGVKFESYDTWKDCFEHFSEYQMWIRVVMLVILWAEYWLEVFIPRITVPHFKGPLWFDIYSVVFFLYIFSYSIAAFQFSEGFNLYRSIYLTIFIVAVTLVELYTDIMDVGRIKVTNHIKEDYEQFLQTVDEQKMDYLQTRKDVFYHIEAMVMEKQLYTTRGLKIGDVAYECKLTKSQVEQAYLSAGYASYEHFLAKCRVVALKELLLKNNGRNVLDLYVQVGFTNRAVAAKSFKLFTGMTPTEWVKKEKRTLYSSDV